MQCAHVGTDDTVIASCGLTKAVARTSRFTPFHIDSVVNLAPLWDALGRVSGTNDLSIVVKAQEDGSGNLLLWSALSVADLNPSLQSIHMYPAAVPITTGRPAGQPMGELFVVIGAQVDSSLGFMQESWQEMFVL